MPEKINIEMSASEAKHFEENYGNNPELLMANELGRRAPTFKPLLIASIGIVCFSVSVFSLGYLLTKARAETKEITHLLEEGNAKIDNAAKIIADDVLAKLNSKERAVSIIGSLAENSDFNHQNKEGRTILHQAVKQRLKPRTFNFLIEQGADLNQRAYGFDVNGKRDPAILGLTPVMAAMFAGQKDKRCDDIVLHLITKHADKINFALESKSGQTLLEMAITRLNAEPDCILLKAIVRACELHQKGNT